MLRGEEPLAVPGANSGIWAPLRVLRERRVRGSSLGSGWRTQPRGRVLWEFHNRSGLRCSAVLLLHGL